MRFVLLLLSALFASTGSAHAQAFVPADPPPQAKVECVNAAGDLVITGDGNGGLDTHLVMSTAGGPWTPLSGVDNCGALAVAPDGTAALVAPLDGGRPGVGMIVRRPGGAFGAALALGASPETPEVAVAVAPGGWAMAVWEKEPRDALGTMIVRPDGSVARSVITQPLARPGEPENYGRAKIALNSNGDATIVFAHSVHTTVRLATARVVAGGAPVIETELPGVSDGNFEFDLASSPGGHSIMTWATKHGLQSMVDGGAAETVAPTTAASDIASAIADDGSAVIAYSNRKGELIAIDRAAATPWSGPHVLAPAPARRDTGDGPSSPRTVVAPGGQPAVAWSAQRGKIAAVRAASGQAGGAWTRAETLSSPAWDAYPSALTLSAGGVPRVFWREYERADALRAATLAPAKLDTTPPMVIAHLPKRVTPTRTGRLAATVRVRCSEACDARLTVTVDKVDRGHASRAITPGKAATLRLPTASEFTPEPLLHPGSRRVHLELLVSDRAGNVVRQQRTVRVHEV